MSKTIYLYLKTHNRTGLKYLGKTIENPHTYKGSGVVWRRHLDKHGDGVTTEVIFQSNDKSEFRDVALYYSKLWNIVESDKFANLTEESGQGGATRNGYSTSEETKLKISLSVKNNNYRRGKPGTMLGRKHSEETKLKMKNRNPIRKPRSEETKRKISEAHIKRHQKNKKKP